MHATTLEGLEVLRKLIAFPTVQGEPVEGAPFGDSNGAALRFILDVLAKEGFKVENLDGYCGYAEVGTGELFGVLGHLDVVPVSGEWKYPPFSATIAEGYLWGRGAQDDKGPMISAVYAAIRALREGLVPTKRLRFIFGCNEESGWRCVEHYRTHAEMPKIGFSPDADFPVINCEKGVVYHTIEIKKPSWLASLNSGVRPNMVPDFAEIEVQKGSFAEDILAKSFQFKDGKYIATGISAHGSTPEQGESALLKLLAVLPDENIQHLYKALRFSDGSGCNLNVSDEKSGTLSMNLGTAKSTENSLIFELDIRFPVSFSKEFISEKLIGWLQPLGKVSMGAFHEPQFVPANHPLVDVLLSAYESVTGEKAKPISIGGATFARFLPFGVAFGPIFPDEESTIHQANERISLENYDKMSEIYYRALKELCFR